jgi:hypothetical protein
VAIADGKTMRPLDARYFIITPEFERGGIYEGSLFIVDKYEMLMRHELESELTAYLEANGIKRIFAYNARFDHGLLPELSAYIWHDIMAVAAYRQFNKSIPDCADCYKTGRLKRGFGVEPILRMLSGETNYFETHNAVVDALDELTIMRLLAHPISVYECAII